MWFDRKRRKGRTPEEKVSNMIERADATPLSMDIDRVILAACSAGMVLERTEQPDTIEGEREVVLDALADGSIRWATQDPSDHTKVILADAGNLYYWMQETIFGMIVDPDGSGSGMP